MSTKVERSEAAAMLGELGGKRRWESMTQRERTEFVRQGAAARWPSYRLALEMERQSDEKTDDRSTL
jgi:hypothetical protein